MPITSPGIIGAVTANLNAATVIGMGVPQYASAVAQGLILWVPQIRVVTVDTGSAGAGTNVPLPIAIATPVLYSNLFTGATDQGMMGMYLPIFLNGLANGLTIAFVQMLIETVHPSVGTGAGVATFLTPPATPSMIAGFTSAGLTGLYMPRAAAALGIALDLTFATLSLPVVIVGSASPVPATGVGTGGIV